jgi:hypothetical protein
VQKQRLRPMNPTPQELRGLPPARARAAREMTAAAADGRMAKGDALRIGPSRARPPLLVGIASGVGISAQGRGGLVNSGRPHPRLATNLQRAASVEKAASAVKSCKRGKKVARSGSRERRAGGSRPAERKPTASLAPPTEHGFGGLVAPWVSNAASKR